MKNSVLMKVDVSVEDDLTAECDGEAQQLGMSRSAFFAEALREYLFRLQQARITRKLDEVYKEGQDKDERRFTQAIKKNFAVRFAVNSTSRSDTSVDGGHQ